MTANLSDISCIPSSSATIHIHQPAHSHLDIVRRMILHFFFFFDIFVVVFVPLENLHDGFEPLLRVVLHVVHDRLVKLWQLRLRRLWNSNKTSQLASVRRAISTGGHCTGWPATRGVQRGHKSVAKWKHLKLAHLIQYMIWDNFATFWSLGSSLHKYRVDYHLWVRVSLLWLRVFLLWLRVSQLWSRFRLHFQFRAGSVPNFPDPQCLRVL